MFIPHFTWTRTHCKVFKYIPKEHKFEYFGEAKEGDELPDALFWLDWPLVQGAGKPMSVFLFPPGCYNLIKMICKKYDNFGDGSSYFFQLGKQCGRYGVAGYREGDKAKIF